MRKGRKRDFTVGLDVDPLRVPCENIQPLREHRGRGPSAEVRQTGGHPRSDLTVDSPLATADKQYGFPYQDRTSHDFTQEGYRYV